MSQPNKPARVVEIGKPMPTTEDERTLEALYLISLLSEEDNSKLTSWEMNTITELRAGRAATTVRLREMRSIAKRLGK